MPKTKRKRAEKTFHAGNLLVEIDEIHNFLALIELICTLCCNLVKSRQRALHTRITTITIGGTFKTHSGGAQMGQDSEISFIVGAYATVTIERFCEGVGITLSEFFDRDYFDSPKEN